MRLLSDMFAEKAKRRKVNKIQYRLSFVELRGKEVKDLLLAKTENRIKINDTDAFKVSKLLIYFNCSTFSSFSFFFLDISFINNI